jgi:hypothetical protein
MTTNSSETGKVLAISGNGPESGYPKSAGDLAHYTKALEAASPKLTRADIDALREKLKHYGK